MYCPNCVTMNEDRSLYCKRCGASLAQASAKSRGTRPAWILPVICACVVLVAGLLAGGIILLSRGTARTGSAGGNAAASGKSAGSLALLYTDAEGLWLNLGPSAESVRLSANSLIREKTFWVNNRSVESSQYSETGKRVFYFRSAAGSDYLEAAANELCTVCLEGTPAEQKLGEVTAYAVSSDGNTLTYLNADSDLCQYYFDRDAKGRVARKISGDTFSVSADGKAVAYERNGRLCLWTAETGEQAVTENYVNHWQLSADGSTVTYVENSVLYQYREGSQEELGACNERFYAGQDGTVLYTRTQGRENDSPVEFCFWDGTETRVLGRTAAWYNILHEEGICSWVSLDGRKMLAIRDRVLELSGDFASDDALSLLMVDDGGLYAWERIPSIHAEGEESYDRGYAMYRIPLTGENPTRAERLPDCGFFPKDSESYLLNGKLGYRCILDLKDTGERVAGIYYAGELIEHEEQALRLLGSFSRLIDDRDDSALYGSIGPEKTLLSQGGSYQIYNETEYVHQATDPAELFSVAELEEDASSEWAQSHRDAPVTGCGVGLYWYRQGVVTQISDQIPDRVILLRPESTTPGFAWDSRS